MEEFHKLPAILPEEQSEKLPQYKHIESNEFSYRKHMKQKEEDIAICVCQYDTNDPDSACGESCLNVLTSTECTPGYCPCGNFCRNQKFQKCEYAQSRLFRTEGRGWGLLADENIKAGKFIIEYCGEVISSKEAKRRSLTYETEGLEDAYIIFLNTHESIDATRKGSLARFINHSCQPNCETRKWTVLGEVRVGIFARQDIPVGTELSYDYNFEWYGGAKVRCLCGADRCSGFLGAKSRGFQEATHVWEDDDDRYSVEDIPIYDSEDDEPTSQLSQAIVPSVSENEDLMSNADGQESSPISVEPLNSIPMEMDGAKIGKLKQKSSVISPIHSNSAWKSKIRARKEFNVTQIAERLSSKEAREDLVAHEEVKNLAKSRLDSLYDEIRPAIEEHERDSQESVPTSVAERWIEASCNRSRAEFDHYLSLIKTILCNHPTPQDHDTNFKDAVQYLENGQ